MHLILCIRHLVIILLYLYIFLPLSKRKSYTRLACQTVTSFPLIHSGDHPFYTTRHKSKEKFSMSGFHNVQNYTTVLVTSPIFCDRFLVHIQYLGKKNTKYGPNQLMPCNITHNCKFTYVKTVKNKTRYYFLLSLMLTVFIHFCYRKHYVSIMKDSQNMLLREIITFY